MFYTNAAGRPKNQFISQLKNVVGVNDYTDDWTMYIGRGARAM